MEKEKGKQFCPDYLFEVSWEVCNLVGGIYTVLSTKARTLQEINKDRTIFIGPDLVKDNQYFKESATLLKDWRQKVSEDGFKVRVGRWKVPGTPIVILVDFKDTYSHKNEIYTRMWEDFGVDSIHAYGDYDDSCMFGVTAAKVIEHYYRYIGGENYKVVAHFDEWIVAMGLLYIKRTLPSVVTVFTTHSTCVGRSIASNNKPLYDYLPGYFGDQMARELNMDSKHSLEKAAAQYSDAFTTVSSITAKECKQLLEREPAVTPNGFEPEIVPPAEKYASYRKAARKKLFQIAEALTGKKIDENTLLVATSGRNEYRNKGIDLYLDSLKRVLNNYKGERRIIAFVLVPAWVGAVRDDVASRLKKGVDSDTPIWDPFITHYLYNYNEDRIVGKIHDLHFGNRPEDKLDVIYIPSYLKGKDGVVNMSYYNLLTGFDLTVFPSYYEPWGYTPLESVAFGIPTVTTSLSGFGMWVKDKFGADPVKSGVYVFERTDANYDSVADEIASTIMAVADMPDEKYKSLCKAASKTASKADWKSFITHYLNVYKKAFDKNKRKKI